MKRKARAEQPCASVPSTVSGLPRKLKLQKNSVAVIERKKQRRRGLQQNIRKCHRSSERMNKNLRKCQHNICKYYSNVRTQNQVICINKTCMKYKSKYICHLCFLISRAFVVAVLCSIALKRAMEQQKLFWKSVRECSCGTGTRKFSHCKVSSSEKQYLRRFSYGLRRFSAGGGGARGFSFPTIGKMALLRGEFCFLKSVVFSMFFLSRATVCWLQECNLAWAAKSSPEESYREEPVFKATPFCLFASTF